MCSRLFSQTKPTLFLLISSVLVVILLYLPLSSVAGLAEGTNFWLTFPNNSGDDIDLGASLELRLLISSESSNVVTVSIPGISFSVNESLVAGDVMIVDLPVNAELYTVETVEYKGIHVTASNPVLVRAVSIAPSSSESFLALPVEQLGSDYVVTTSYLGQPGFSSEFAVISTNPGMNDVILTLTTDSATIMAGVPTQVALQQGDTFLVQSSNDLNGSIIQSSQPVAVIAGSDLACVPSDVILALPLIEWVDYRMRDERQRLIRPDFGYQEPLAGVRR